MLVAKFKSIHPALTVQMILLAALLWIDGFIFFREINVSYQDYSPFYGYINEFSVRFPFLSVATGFIFLLTQAFLFNMIITTSNLTDRTSYLPALIYLVFMSSSFGLLGLHPISITNFFTLIIIHKIFNLTTSENLSIEVFNIGFLISVASFFYLTAFWFIALLILSLLAYYVFNLRTILASLLGFFTPYMFAALYFFWFDMLGAKHANFINVFKPIDFSFLQMTGFGTAAIIIFAIITMFVILHIYLTNIQTHPVRIQKRFKILLIFLFVSLISILFSGDYAQIHYGLVMLPLAAIFAAFLQNKKWAFWNELIFTVILILIIAGKLVRHA